MFIYYNYKKKKEGVDAYLCSKKKTLGANLISRDSNKSCPGRTWRIWWPPTTRLMIYKQSGPQNINACGQILDNDGYSYFVISLHGKKVRILVEGFYCLELVWHNNLDETLGNPLPAVPRPA